MAESNKLGARNLIDTNIKIDGNSLPKSFQLLSIEVHKSANKMPSATLVFSDGDIASDDYEFIESKYSKPGVEIEIQVGDESSQDTIFEGIVVQVSLSVAQNISCTTIECADKASRLTLVKESAIFSKQTDADILKAVIAKGSSASSDVDSTSEVHESIVQYYVNDWEFILARTKANSMVVYVEDNQVRVKTMKLATAALTLDLDAGVIFDFEGKINAKPSVEQYENSSWDYTKQQREQGKASKSDVDSLGNIATSSLADVFSITKKGFNTDANISKDSLATLASAEQLYAQLASKTGSVSFAGDASLKLGDTIELKGVSARFDGNAIVTSIQHTVEAGNWTTQVGFGIDASFLPKGNNTNGIDYGASTKVDGLLVGTVLATHEDPAEGYRVQVKISSVDNESESVWARLQQPYASNKYGSFFYPEIEDEVLLGFVGNDPNSAVILGSLYSQKHPPIAEPAEGNHVKSIVTRSQLSIDFDDEKTIFTIHTPKGQSFCLNDDEDTVTLNDSNGNSLVMSDQGISLESEKDITLTAEGNVKITAKQNIEHTASLDCSTKATNISQKGDVGVAIEGPQVEAKASGIMTISGSMVMIN